MKRKQTVRTINFISVLPFALPSFNALPNDASDQQQIKALYEDKRWLVEITKRVQAALTFLIEEIQND